LVVEVAAAVVGAETVGVDSSLSRPQAARTTRIKSAKIG
jgi:hypothetical protein